MSNGTKASFVIGAIGGFLIALIYIPGSLGWTFDDVPWDEGQFWLILVLATILISIGFIGLWRKSGNVIPLVSAICIIAWDIIAPLRHYLVTYISLVIPSFGIAGTSLAVIFMGVGWITAGIAAWLLREEFSPFSIVAALVFLAFGAVNFLVPLIASVTWNIWNSIFFIAAGIVAGIYFLDAART
ncbi:MAG: hypothetical protein ACXADL_01590 [Candidatus Thorarchaeota archaeon]